MIDEHFVWLGGFLLLIGAGAYIRDVWTGRAKPNLVTWFLWALAPLIAFAGQLQRGAGAEVVLTFVVGFCPALVFISALKKGFFRPKKFDIVCGGMSVVALILWQLTGDGQWAVLLSILADGLAATPTIIKSFHHPHSESPLFFGSFMASAIITLLTIQQWTFASSAFAVYILLLYSLLFGLVYFKLGPRFHSRKITNKPEQTELPS